MDENVDHFVLSVSVKWKWIEIERFIYLVGCVIGGVIGGGIVGGIGDCIGGDARVGSVGSGVGGGSGVPVSVILYVK